jgi:hypothetical protein
LFGEPGKGDPLAHPRITLRTRAVRVPRDDEGHAALRARFISRHPKAALYADFPDFTFFRMVPESASLNGGFGKAYVLEASDLVIRSPAMADMAAIEPGAIEHMNSDHAGTADAMPGLSPDRSAPAGGSAESTAPDWISPTEMSLSGSNSILYWTRQLIFALNLQKCRDFASQK